MLEKDLKLAVQEYLEYGQNQEKWLYLRLNSGEAIVKRGERSYKMQLCPKGTADILVLASNGRYDTPNKLHCIPIFLELKSSKGKQTVDQMAFERNVIVQGCEYHIIRSVEQLEGVLRWY